MDFFEAQARAQRRTKWLVFLFALAVIGTSLAGYVVAMFAVNGHAYSNRPRDYSVRRPDSFAHFLSTYSHPADWWNPPIFAWVAGGTAGIIGLASLGKWWRLRAGGAAIAEMVGGRAVDPKTADLRERKLLNVVEEMSIASGIPVPAVYILDDEPALNAFAAGLTTADAAVAVTRGCLEKLNREELQGVIGHEFSHILNGDMRLNVRITAIVYGILMIGLIGRGILQSLGRGRVRSSGNDKGKGNGVFVIIALGVAALVIGYVGYFFGRLIQAAVSRQREFLADASAVQFTRNSDGLGGALKKIGGYHLGSHMLHRNAGELSHFFFAQAFNSNFGGFWATHPALDERIRAVEPHWDGQMFEPPEVVDIATESSATAGFYGGQRLPFDEAVQRAHEAPADIPPPLPPVVPLKFTPAAVVADVGALTASHFRHAQALLESIPTQLREATREPRSAQALAFGLLLHGDKPARDAQVELVGKYSGPDFATTLKSQRPSLSVLDPAARLPLLQLALPSLRRLDAGGLDRFAGTLDELVHADENVSPFEYALQKMLLSQLQLSQAPARAAQFNSPASVHAEISIVLSALARVGDRTGAAAAGAFLSGATQLPAIATQLVFRSAADSGLEQVDAALDKLALAALPLKQSLLLAAGHVIAHDGTVTLEEGELYRAFAATLDCPMPQLS